MDPNKENVMRQENFLPEDFDGTFYFSNPSKEDFVGVWGQKEYLFPAGTTVPLIMASQTPIEVQHIRKKFAKDLAEREFYKSKGYETLRGGEGKPGNRNYNSIHQATAYTIKDLEPYIQSCLKPLPVSKLLSKQQVTIGAQTEEKIHKKDDGTHTTQAIDKKTSLRQKALES